MVRKVRKSNCTVMVNGRERDNLGCLTKAKFVYISLHYQRIIIKLSNTNPHFVSKNATFTSHKNFIFTFSILLKCDNSAMVQIRMKIQILLQLYVCSTYSYWNILQSFSHYFYGTLSNYLNPISPVVYALPFCGILMNY